MSGEDPHGEQQIETTGAPLADADAAVVLAHGRGATARGILGLSREVGIDGVAYLAPQAARNTWYPRSFMEPIEDNQPWLSSALAFFGRTVERAADAVAHEQVVLGGFSQGACLASEFAARNAREYGGVVALSGGLIGPEGTEFDSEGSMDGISVFLGCSDSDPHIPLERVHETADAFEDLGADVDERIYEGMGHGVNEDEVDAVRDLVTRVVDGD
ncbi:phospholipase [Halobacteriales archaeon QS_1_68_20]|nr:MAG: phospholipase [Halobacteriales archaeon QS_1_68_20]